MPAITALVAPDGGERDPSPPREKALGQLGGLHLQAHDAGGFALIGECTCGATSAPVPGPVMPDHNPDPVSAPPASSPVIATNINRSGYLVRDDCSRRTYACADLSSLHALIYYLTGRTADTFPIDQTRGGVPSVRGLNIAEGLHIWGDLWRGAGRDPHG